MDTRIRPITAATIMLALERLRPDTPLLLEGRDIVTMTVHPEYDQDHVLKWVSISFETSN